MFYIRDKDTGYLLRGMGRGSAYYGRFLPVWGGMKDIQWAKVFSSISKARTFIKRYGLEHVEILNVVCQPVWDCEDGDDDVKAGKSA